MDKVYILTCDCDNQCFLNFIQSEDAGNYMCVATNDAGVVERSVTLTLQSKCLFSLCPIRGVVEVWPCSSLIIDDFSISAPR